MKEVGVSEPVWISHANMDSIQITADSIGIGAVIKTKSGIASASIYWTTDTTSGFIPAAMQFVNADSAVGYIPPQLDSTIVYYYVSATSNSGRRVTKPLVAPEGFYKFIVENSVTDISEFSQPEEFILYQNYPNPFNPTTKIKFSVPNVETGHASSLQIVTIKVYDVLGNEIATLVNDEKPAGEYEVEFQSKQLTSGIYFYKLKAGPFIQTKKMLLLK